MVLGTSGGSRIVTAVQHMVLNVLDYDMDIQEAVDAPPFEQRWLPEKNNLKRFARVPARARARHYGPEGRCGASRNTLSRSLVGASAWEADTDPSVRGEGYGAGGGILNGRRAAVGPKSDLHAGRRATQWS